jgi:hypothetical protein
LGPRGWVQILNFCIIGVSLLLFSRGVAAEIREGIAARGGPLLIAIIGFAFLLSGPFVMDPVTTPFLHMSWHSRLHYLFGAFVFSLAPVSCFVLFRRFRTQAGWQLLKWITFLSGVVLTASIVLMKAASMSTVLHDWMGVIQRAALITYLAWVGVFAFRLLKRRPESEA